MFFPESLITDWSPFFEKAASFYIKTVTQILIFFLNLQRNNWHIIIFANSLANVIDKSKTAFCFKNLFRKSIIYQIQSNLYKLHQMFSFEIESQVTWNSLPILPSIFGLSSQNIVIPHYSCHSVGWLLVDSWQNLIPPSLHLYSILVIIISDFEIISLRVSWSDC